MNHVWGLILDVCVAILTQFDLRPNEESPSLTPELQTRPGYYISLLLIFIKSSLISRVCIPASGSSSSVFVSRFSCLFTAHLYLDVCVNMLLFLQQWSDASRLDTSTCPHYHTYWSVNDTHSLHSPDDITHTPAFTHIAYYSSNEPCVTFIWRVVTSEMIHMLTFLQ